MRIATRPGVLGVVSLLVGLAAVPVVAPAGQRDCRIAISKETARFIQAKSLALQQCQNNAPPGNTSACQTDPGVAARIADAIHRAHRRILEGCCGSDLTCGGPHDHDPGWSDIPTCPNFESGNCTNAIGDDAANIADCTVCVGGAATDQLIALLYGTLVPGGGSTVLRCQKSMGKDTVRFYRRKSMVLQKCWERRFLGRHDNACPDPGDGKAVAAIVSAENQMRTAICKECGGPDKLCGDGDDLTLSSVSTLTQCPNVTVPNDGGPHSGESCTRPIATFQDLLDCLVCVAEFKDDCVDDLAVPQFATYSANCNVTP